MLDTIRYVKALQIEWCAFFSYLDGPGVDLHRPRLGADVERRVRTNEAGMGRQERRY